jgi:hypothetical protein
MSTRRRLWENCSEDGCQHVVVTLPAFKNPCRPGWRIFSQPAVRKGLKVVKVSNWISRHVYGCWLATMYVDSEAQLYYFANFNTKRGTATGSFLVIKGPSGNKTVTEILPSHKWFGTFRPKHALHYENMMWSVNEHKYSEALKFIIPRWTFSHSFFRDAFTWICYDACF